MRLVSGKSTPKAPKSNKSNSYTSGSIVLGRGGVEYSTFQVDPLWGRGNEHIMFYKLKYTPWNQFQRRTLSSQPWNPRSLESFVKPISGGGDCLLEVVLDVGFVHQIEIVAASRHVDTQPQP